MCVSLGPTVAAATTAMPSIAAESKAGEDRRAHTASAVTRPTASPTGTRTAGTRSGHPAAAQAAAQACKRLGGRDVGDERASGCHDRTVIAASATLWLRITGTA